MSFASGTWATEPAKRKIVFLGDSLTFGFGVGKSKSFPNLIQERLMANANTQHWQVVNSGISGSTTAGALSRMKWILRSKPDIVVLALGANDGLRGIASENSFGNLSKAIEAAQAANATVILAGMKLPPNYGKEAVAKFEAIYPKLASQYQLTLIPFLLKGVAAEPSLNIEDGIHPNEAGHKVIAKNIFPIIKKAIDARSEKSK